MIAVAHMAGKPAMPINKNRIPGCTYTEPGIGSVGLTEAQAVAQVTAVSQTQLKQLPQGTTPPLILQYSASNVPILQLSLTSKTLSEQSLNDLSLNFIRPRLTITEYGNPY